MKKYFKCFCQSEQLWEFLSFAPNAQIGLSPNDDFKIRVHLTPNGEIRKIEVAFFGVNSLGYTVSTQFQYQQNRYFFENSEIEIFKGKGIKTQINFQYE